MSDYNFDSNFTTFENLFKSFFLTSKNYIEKMKICHKNIIKEINNKNKEFSLFKNNIYLDDFKIDVNINENDNYFNMDDDLNG